MLEWCQILVGWQHTPLTIYAHFENPTTSTLSPHSEFNETPPIINNVMESREVMIEEEKSHVPFHASQ